MRSASDCALIPTDGGELMTADAWIIRQTGGVVIAAGDLCALLIADDMYAMKS